MSRRVPDYVLVLDLETSGLDYHQDHILEIGAILVEGAYPFVELGRANMVLHPGADRTQLWGQMPEVVRDMHSTSGLWEETASRDAWSLTDADKALRDWIVDKVGGPPLPMISMAGTGVAAFDLQVVRAQMPNLNSILHYRPIDTSPVHTMLALAGRDDLIAQFADEPAHRALADAERGLAELRVFVELFGQLPRAEATVTPAAASA